MKHVDADFHMKCWITFLEDNIYGHPLDPSDFIFTALTSNATVKRDAHISHDVIQEMIHTYAAGSGISLGIGKFTTHCFRQGGAQYCFMLAPVGQHWLLSKVCWWGGWLGWAQVRR